MTAFATLLVPHARRIGRRDLYLIDFEALPMLVDAREIRVLSVNPLGREALPGLLAGDVDGAVRELAARYGVPADRVGADLRAFQDDLRGRGFLGDGSGRRGGGVALAAPLAAAARAVGRLRLPAVARADEAALRPAVARLLRQAWLDLRVRGWEATLRAWAVRPAAAQPRPAAAAIDLVHRLVLEEAAGQWVCACACKERALVAAYCLERFFGLPARIVVGIVPVPFQLHAWAECDGRPLTDKPDRIAQFEPLIGYRLAAPRA